MAERNVKAGSIALANIECFIHLRYRLSFWTLAPKIDTSGSEGIGIGPANNDELKYKWIHTRT